MEKESPREIKEPGDPLTRFAFRPSPRSDEAFIENHPHIRHRFNQFVFDQLLWNLDDSARKLRPYFLWINITSPELSIG
ncbi:hypothetical protein [Neobacillus terrae]|uniref:hypothetical protein n=1 Tax=Neobacillus terrae TaxID=3034837 RepID=UPI00140AA3CC|nr:hypothetical protein [Neobacillus terrae]NHM32934.1 hypothetical protein [Neobacillus terrae]